jgi:prepilin-type N-terminal cleavage/methylation domain-containing protein
MSVERVQRVIGPAAHRSAAARADAGGVASRLRLRVTRLASDESGFTLIELLIVIQIVAILLLTSVPTYLAQRDRAYKAAAGTNLRGLVIAAQFYAQDNYMNSPSDPDKATSTRDSGYAGMTVAELKTYDANLSSTGYVNNSGTEAAGVTARATLDATHYCLYAVVGRWYAYQLNPAGTPLTTTSPTQVCT